MKKYEVLSKIIQSGIVPVIRAESAEKAEKIVNAVYRGGISVIELTMTVPFALDVIKEVVKNYGDKVTVGVGSVLDPETARAAQLAGAEFVVCPHLNLDILKLCNRYQIPCLPGAMTTTQVVEALELGADIIKIFPGEVCSPKMIKALKGPLPQAALMPTGGVSLENMSEWFNAGAVAVGAGSSLTKGAKKNDYDEIEKTARKFLKEIERIRQNKG